MRKHTLGALGLLVLGAASATSFAAVPWTVPAGVAPGNTFSYSNGGSDFGLFGNPIVLTDGFRFFPSNFAAESSNGVAETTYDRLFVTIDLPTGTSTNYLTGMSVSDVGTYSILGTGSVMASGLETVTVLSNDGTMGAPAIGTTLFDALTTTPAFPVSTTTSATGPWTGEASIMIPDGVKSLQLVFKNTLQATSGPNGTSFIQKENVGIEIDFDIVPEPTTLAAVMGGASLLLVRRRKI